MKRLKLSLFFVFFALPLFAGQQDLTLADRIDKGFEPVVEQIEKILFWDPISALGFNIDAHVPFVVMWLLFGGIFFTLRMKFVNIRGFRHAVSFVRGKYSKSDDKGEVSSFQALATALSATVGLGNIAGVAIAVSIGGPGATFWMIIAGFFGMTLKFAECTLGMKYRKIDENGVVYGGPMYYLRDALGKKKGFRRLGKILALFFSVMIVMASLGGGNMFQANQAFSQVVFMFPALEPYGFPFGVLLAILVGVVIIGGIRSIARVTSRVVPFMGILYVITCLIIIIINIADIGVVIRMIVSGAFSPDSVAGGVIGAIIVGIQRGTFSSEAGVGSAAIAHSAARVKEPVSEGMVALLEPFIDTVVICTMTSMVIIFTGLYHNPGGLEGTQLTSAAFATVFPWYPYLLGVAILLFAFSTMISWSYYGLKGFDFITGKFSETFFGSRRVSAIFYQMVFLIFIVIGSSSGMGSVIDFSDMMLLTLAFPNIAGLLILAPEIRKDLSSYMKRLKAGEIKRYR